MSDLPEIGSQWTYTRANSLQFTVYSYGVRVKNANGSFDWVEPRDFHDLYVPFNEFAVSTGDLFRRQPTTAGPVREVIEFRVYDVEGDDVLGLALWWGAEKPHKDQISRQALLNGAYGWEKVDE